MITNLHHDENEQNLERNQVNRAPPPHRLSTPRTVLIIPSKDRSRTLNRAGIGTPENCECDPPLRATPSSISVLLLGRRAVDVCPFQSYQGKPEWWEKVENKAIGGRWREGFTTSRGRTTTRVEFDSSHGTSRLPSYGRCFYPKSNPSGSNMRSRSFVGTRTRVIQNRNGGTTQFLRRYSLS